MEEYKRWHLWLSSGGALLTGLSFECRKQWTVGMKEKLKN